MRINEYYPRQITEELIRLIREDPDWMQLKLEGENGFRTHIRSKTWLSNALSSGGFSTYDTVSVFTLSHAIGYGCKVFYPTKEQCSIFENVDVNILPGEYSQPFPAMFVMVDMPPFSGCICAQFKDYIVFQTLRKPSVELDKDEDGVVCPIRTSDNIPIEKSISRMFDVPTDISIIVARIFRIACNSCLALSNFGSRAEYFYPKEAESDTRLAKESSARGEKAKNRLSLATQRLTFAQEVKLHETEGSRERSTETGAEVSPHWRRGHWAMQPHGPKMSLRKRIFRKPVLVRPDLFVGDLSNTSTTYHT